MQRRKFSTKILETGFCSNSWGAKVRRMRHDGDISSVYVDEDNNIFGGSFHQ